MIDCEKDCLKKLRNGNTPKRIMDYGLCVYCLEEQLQKAEAKLAKAINYIDNASPSTKQLFVYGHHIEDIEDILKGIGE